MTNILLILVGFVGLMATYPAVSFGETFRVKWGGFLLILVAVVVLLISANYPR